MWWHPPRSIEIYWPSFKDSLTVSNCSPSVLELWLVDILSSRPFGGGRFDMNHLNLAHLCLDFLKTKQGTKQYHGTNNPQDQRLTLKDCQGNQTHLIAFTFDWKATQNPWPHFNFSNGMWLLWKQASIFEIQHKWIWKPPKGWVLFWTDHSMFTNRAFSKFQMKQADDIYHAIKTGPKSTAHCLKNFSKAVRRWNANKNWF